MATGSYVPTSDLIGSSLYGLAQDEPQDFASLNGFPYYNANRTVNDYASSSQGGQHADVQTDPYVPLVDTLGYVQSGELRQVMLLDDSK